MNYPTTVIHFDFAVNETERQIAEIYVHSLLDAIAINANDDELLAWIESEAQQAYARASNLRAALRYRQQNQQPCPASVTLAPFSEVK